MRKVIHKLFWQWDFDKEEKWLNEMAAKGLALTAVGWCRYEFEDCSPGEFKVCIDFFENPFSKFEKEKSIEFLEETGAEHIGTFMGRWAYFRKRTAGEDFKLFSDNASRIKYLTRIIRFIAVFFWINFCWCCSNFIFCFSLKSPVNGICGFINLLVAALIMNGLRLLFRKRKKLKAEQQIYE